MIKKCFEIKLYTGPNLNKRQNNEDTWSCQLRHSRWGGRWWGSSTPLLLPPPSPSPASPWCWSAGSRPVLDHQTRSRFISSYFRFHITSHHFPQICTCQAITSPPSCHQIRIWALIGTCATMPMFLPLLSPAPRFRCHSPIWNKNMSKKSLSYMAFGSWYENSKIFSSKHNHHRALKLNL